MKFFSIAFLIGSASTALGYSIDESCDACGATPRIKAAIEEAKAVLSYGAKKAAACAALTTSNEVCDVDQRKMITQNLLGDLNVNTYSEIKKALEPAWEAIGDFSATVDKLNIACGDSTLKLISGMQWRDQKRKYADVSVKPQPGPNQTPCDTAIVALAYDTSNWNGGKTIMICNNKPGSGLNQMATFSQLNKGNIVGWEVDRLTSSISSIFTHEMIHVGNILEYPRQLSAHQAEVYNYEGCHNLRNSDERWHNADTFAILARVWYMNNYYAPDSKFKVLPKNERPDTAAVNGPPAGLD